MTILWAALFIIILAFGFVVAFGAPFVPTLKRQRETAFKMLSTKPGQVFYDLGCGDGRLLETAAKAGLKAVGYEINPILVAVAWWRVRRYRGQVKVVWGNFWQANISEADAVFVFLIERHMKRLDKYLSRQFRGKPVQVVSYAFKVPGKKPIKEINALYLYQYGRAG